MVCQEKWFSVTQNRLRSESAPKNFANFTGKHLRWSLYLTIIAQMLAQDFV